MLITTAVFTNHKSPYKKKEKFKEYKSNSKLEKEYGLGKYITNFYKEINEKANNTILVEIGLRLLNLLVEVKLIHTEIISLERKSKVTIFC